MAGCGGILYHWISLHDPFSHMNKSISTINILQFSEREWDKWSGNRFMYNNRVRSSDYYELFAEQRIKDNF